MAHINLDGINAKIARALEHGHALNDEIKAWYDSKPYAFAKKVNDERTRWSITFDEVHPPNVPRWALMLGDFAHNLRSALDHLFFAIAERYAPGALVQQRTFPIVEPRKRFEKFVAVRTALRIPPDVWAAIEKEQPYNRREGDVPPLLAMLNQLAITDKHHMLAVVLLPKTQGSWTDLKLTGRFEVIWDTHFMQGIANVEPGAEISVLTIHEPSPDMNPKFNLTAAVAVKYAPDFAPMEISNLLNALGNEVEAVVKRVSASVT